MSLGSTAGSTASGAATGASIGGPAGAVIGGGIGLVSGLLGSAAEKRKQQAEAEILAAQTRASPWTHMAPTQQIQFAAPAAGNIIGGVGAGLGLAQSFEKAGTPNPWAGVGQSTLAPIAMEHQQADPNAMFGLGGLDPKQYMVASK